MRAETGFKWVQEGLGEGSGRSMKDSDRVQEGSRKSRKGSDRVPVGP